MHRHFIELDAYPSQLLDDHLTVARRRHPDALAATALRARSYAARHILARAVSKGLTLPDLLDLAGGGHLARGGDRFPAERANRLDPVALAELARVVALQGIRDEDHKDGLALYDLALTLAGPARIPERHQGIHAQLAYHLGERDRAAELLSGYPQMPGLVRAALGLDLANPFTGDGTATESEWLKMFHELLPDPAIGLAGDDTQAPFDRLTAKAERPITSGPKISVIVTSYKPDAGLVTAVRSVLAQSWTNLEALIADDGSPSEYDPVLKQCLGLDDRVKLVKLEQNSGTYTARNTAFDVSTGDFITFHDSDDWAHPLRLQTQIQPLIDDPDLVASISTALTVSDQLTITRPGRKLDLLCTPSLMFRKEPVLSRLGYFDAIRKAADTEFLRRIEATFGSKAVRRIPDGYYTLMRQSPDSLSRAEFRTGWRHPAREAYQSAYLPWHQAIKAGKADPFLERNPSVRPFAAPARFSRIPMPRRNYDVVFALDWRPFGGPQKSTLEEIAALTRRGRRVGVMHLESFRHMTERQRPLCTPIQQLINDGTVEQVLPTDEVDTVLFILRYPPILQFRAFETIATRAKKMIILANQAPSETDGSDLRYVPGACHGIARDLFGVEPLWVPQGPMVRAALGEHLPADHLADFDMPGLMDGAQLTPRRTGFRARVPVVGKHSRDDWTKWPADRQTLVALYPDSPDVDVRILGGAKSAARLLGDSEPPENWLVYPYGEVDPRSFLYQLDFYVYFPHPTMIEAFGRAVLEALAAGCVTVLPHHFEETFGDAALYCRPEEVRGFIDGYYADVDRFLAQSALAQLRVAERFSHESYAELVTRLIAEACPGSAGKAP